MNNRSRLFHEIFQTARFLKKGVDEQLKEFGLYHSQWVILHCLKQFGAMTQTEIWQYLNVEAPTVTRTVKRLEDMGWVKRIPGQDKRERVVVLTEKAQAQLPEVERTIRDFEEQMAQGLEQSQEEELYMLLRMIGQRNRKEESIDDN